MKFEFRSQMQLNAGPVHKPAIGFRAVAMHATAIAEAAERFMREQLLRKRARTFGA
jgi:hypothetical protein